jgi:hypothetical protein
MTLAMFKKPDLDRFGPCLCQMPGAHAKDADRCQKSLTPAGKKFTESIPGRLLGLQTIGN